MKPEYIQKTHLLLDTKLRTNKNIPSNNSDTATHCADMRWPFAGTVSTVSDKTEGRYRYRTIAE